MPPSAAQRSSLCLYCRHALTAASRTQQRLFPHNKKPSTQFPRLFSQSRDKARNQAGSSRGIFNPLQRSTRSPNEQISQTLSKLKHSIQDPKFLDSLYLSREQFEEEWDSFTRYIHLWMKRDAPELRKQTHGGARNLQSRLRYLFYAHIYGGRFTQAEISNQRDLAVLRYPAEWYPATREIPRTVHMHVGPTNSGKTYHALKRLEEARRGIYLGPLRLLAHEVYTRLNAKGIPCALVTGEEQRIPSENVSMWSCTVEMAPLNTELDVAVIDEIQMINHKDRGWAWTQAFLGVQAKEIHLCGEARSVPLIKELCGLTGDKVIVHNYERLTPLKVADRSLRGDLNGLEKGDCVVAFSVLGIHALRKQIERNTNRKCAIVYGSLPPETRAQQARLFNDPDNDYDYLVASDAVGMGLNLSIKRVIFESTMKNNGTSYVPLEISEIKQIAGRAGRYRTAHQAINDGAEESAPEVSTESNAKGPTKRARTNGLQTETVGYVTTLENIDFNYLRLGMRREPETIRTAGLFPPSVIVERFANYFPPGTPFSYILLRLHEISELHPRFHLCALKDQLAVADAIHPIKNLSIQERIMICAAPTNARDEKELTFLRALAQCIADNETGNLLSLPIPLELLDEKPSGERSYLYELEQLHKMLVLYLWLSYRFPQVFTTRRLAEYTKKLVEDAIENQLEQFSFTEKTRRRLAKLREKAMLKNLEKEKLKMEGQKATSKGQKGKEVAAPAGAPEEVVEVLEDTTSFGEDTPVRDDEDEYPTPELEPGFSKASNTNAARRSASN